MSPYFLTIIALIIFSIIIILYLRISAKISKISDPEDALNASNIKEGDNDSDNYDSVSKSKFISNDPLSHLKSSNHPTASDFTLLE